MDEEERLLLQDKIRELNASNIRLIAELGRIAQALGVECSMGAVLRRIEELKIEAKR